QKNLVTKFSPKLIYRSSSVLAELIGNNPVNRHGDTPTSALDSPICLENPNLKCYSECRIVFKQNKISIVPLPESIEHIEDKIDVGCQEPEKSDGFEMKIETVETNTDRQATTAHNKSSSSTGMKKVKC